METTTAGTRPQNAQSELEACRGCGTTLATDQRYCLACGTRRGATRVPVSTLFTPLEGAPTPAPAAPAVERPVVTPTVAAIGAMAVVLALVAGLLIGRGGQTATTTPAAAPTITVQGGGGNQTAAADTSSGAAKKSKKHKSKAPKASLTAKGQKVGTADKATLNSLSNSSGKDYQKKSANLPKTTVLPGKPPPKDNKPAGGGTGFQELGG
jgi:hypothetical protein